MINTNLFYMDFTSWLGITILVLLVIFAFFLFIKKAYGISGFLLIFIGLMLVFNEVNILIALIPFIFGVVVAFMDT